MHATNDATVVVHHDPVVNGPGFSRRRIADSSTAELRNIPLAEGIEISDALLDNGLLHIDLIRPEAESRVRNVEIKMGSTAAKRAPVGSDS